MGTLFIMKNKALLQDILDNIIDNKKIFGTSFSISYRGEVWHGSSGNLQVESPYFIASTTKLFTTALIMNLRSQNKLNLEDKIFHYLDESIMKNLHIYKRVNYSYEITIQNLLAHTSGLPDYFQQKGVDGKSLEEKLVSGNDQYWTCEQAVTYTKAMKPMFAPNTKNKAHYSDVNFQLLGKIIESISNKSFEENCHDILIEPLSLKDTYVYSDSQDNTPEKFYFKNKRLEIPKAMLSFGPDGAVVSNSKEMLHFIKAFFSGTYFPKDYIDEMQVWNNIFFPLKSGTGILLFKLLWIFNPLGKMPELIGHSGLSGAIAFYAPKKDIIITGTINQVAYPSLSYKLMLKLVQNIMSSKENRMNEYF